MLRRTRLLTIGLILLLIGPPLAGLAQPAHVPMHRETYGLDSGKHDNLTKSSVLAYKDQIRVSSVPWLRLSFSEYYLGTASYVKMTSSEDGAWQRLDAKGLGQWQNGSAFFNGDEVKVELHVAPGDRGVFFRIKEIVVGERDAEVSGQKSLCGSDDRISSTDPCVGRIIQPDSSAICTGWIVSNGAHLTAGHCCDGLVLFVLQFNVPASDCDGTINHPGPGDQYAIDPGTVIWYHGPDQGQDWAIFGCFPNTNTGLLPVHAQGCFYRMSRDHDPEYVRCTGYGTDMTPIGCTGGFNGDNQTQQTDMGTFFGEYIEDPDDVVLEYMVDSEGGASGAPVQILGTGVTIGIHTSGGCDPPLVGNHGTGFENDDLENVIQTFPGPAVVYVDRNPPSPLQDGTVFRPFWFVNLGVTAVPSGGVVSIVTGSYDEAVTINKAMRLEAPVGPVVIGR